MARSPEFSRLGNVMGKMIFTPIFTLFCGADKKRTFLFHFASANVGRTAHRANRSHLFDIDLRQRVTWFPVWVLQLLLFAKATGLSLATLAYPIDAVNPWSAVRMHAILYHVNLCRPADGTNSRSALSVNLSQMVNGQRYSYKLFVLIHIIFLYRKAHGKTYSHISLIMPLLVPP